MLPTPIWISPITDYEGRLVGWGWLDEAGLKGRGSPGAGLKDVGSEWPRSTLNCSQNLWDARG